MQGQPVALPSAPLIAGIGVATAYPTPKYAASTLNATAPADRMAAAMVRLARLSTKVAVDPVMCSPADTRDRLADMLVGSPIEMA